MMKFHDGDRTELTAPGHAPGWAQGLRQLYRPVADDRVAAAFADLLARIDDRPGDRRPHRLP